MKLYSNPASPFARKCRVIAHELGLKLEVVDIAARDDEGFRAINPLKKIPALVLGDGSALFDSPVICEYLNEFGGGKFFPGKTVWQQNSGRWKALGLQALGDGIMDAAVACRYEITQPEARRNPDHGAPRPAGVVEPAPVQHDPKPDQHDLRQHKRHDAEPRRDRL